MQRRLKSEWPLEIKSGSAVVKIYCAQKASVQAPALQKSGDFKTWSPRVSTLGWSWALMTGWQSGGAWKILSMFKLPTATVCRRYTVALRVLRTENNPFNSYCQEFKNPRAFQLFQPFQPAFGLAGETGKGSGSGNN